MIIGGWQKFSLLDYPGHLAAIIFTQGCNFRCGFCYNPMLVRPAGEFEIDGEKIPGAEKGHSPVNESDLFRFLGERRERLDAVVVTGGEPTIWPDLGEFLRRIRALGYKIKLDTNGTHPERLGRLIADGLVDYIAMDLKSDMRTYAAVAGVAVELDKIAKSIIIIKDSGLPHEFRTTVVPGMHGPEAIEELARLLAGAKHWYLQRFRADVSLIDDRLRTVPPLRPDEEDGLLETARRHVPGSEWR